MTQVGNPFTAAGHWYRGNTHCHTTASDGKLTMAEVAQEYEERGYDFLVITDHNVVADVGQARTSSLQVIPGAEIKVRCDGATGMEVCALGIERVGDTPGHPQEVIDDVLQQGGVPVISHPHMSGAYSGLLMELEGVVGIEVYNAYCQGSGRRGFSLTHWDDLLTAGREVWGLAVDDRHSGDRPGQIDARTFDRHKAWVRVRAAECSREAVLDALRKGLFYATTGPEIDDIAIVDGEIRVQTSPVKSITFASRPWKGAREVAEPGQTLSAASLPLTRVGAPGQLAPDAITRPCDVEEYVRIEVWDGDEGYAWSNPIVLRQRRQS